MKHLVRVIASMVAVFAATAFAGAPGAGTTATSATAAPVNKITKQEVPHKKMFRHLKQDGKPAHAAKDNKSKG